jgi:dynein heavy chain
LILEQQLEKKAGKLYAPPASKKLIYFVDDLNMPGPDPYDTQTAIALLRQHRDYEHWYDKNKLTLKDIHNTQLVASMNPTAGTFFINPRLQRHFWLLSVDMPDTSSLSTIYLAYLQKHFQSFKVTISELVNTVVKSTLSLFGEV